MHRYNYFYDEICVSVREVLRILVVVLICVDATFCIGHGIKFRNAPLANFDVASPIRMVLALSELQRTVGLVHAVLANICCQCD